MSDNQVEKTFLYLVALSVFLHLGIFGLIAQIPPEKDKTGEPTMVDLTDLPPPPKQPESPRTPRRPRKSTQETVSKGHEDIDRARVPAKPPRPSPTETPGIPGTPPARPEPPKRTPQVEAPASGGNGLFKPNTETRLGHDMLFPAARDMARKEESYREKYKAEVEDGETKFLDQNDVRFGSFFRRLETAVYGTWNYPLEARRRGIEGVTSVKVTFNRSGDIVQVKLLDGSGSRILDDEVLRTLKELGTIGSLPKGYTKETFSIITFFNYGMGRGMLR